MQKGLLFGRLVKVDEEKRQVWGVIAAEKADKANEVMDYDASKPHFQKWSETIADATNGASLGNVRVMHKSEVGGKLVEINYDDLNKQIEVCAQVATDGVWDMVKGGYLTGFSIGGSYLSKNKGIDGVTTYVAQPSEVSLVDNPCLKSAHFTMVKADGTQDEVHFAEEVATIVEDVAAGEPATKADAPVAEPVAEPAPQQDAPAPVADSGDGVAKADATDADDEPKQVWVCAGQTFEKKADALLHKAKMADPLFAALQKAQAAESVTVEQGTVSEIHQATLSKAVNAAMLIKSVCGADVLAKGLWGAAELTEKIAQLKWLVDDAFWEAQNERDNSPVPAMLLTGLKQLSDALIAMVKEEVAEMLAAYGVDFPAVADIVAGGTYTEAEATEAVAFANAAQAEFVKTSEAVQGLLNKAAAPAPAIELQDRLEKAEATLQARDESIALAVPQIEKMGKTIETLTARLNKLEATPMAHPLAKAVAPQALEKNGGTSETTEGGAVDQLSEMLKGADLQTVQLALAKAAQARPINLHR